MPIPGMAKPPPPPPDPMEYVGESQVVHEHIVHSASLAKLEIPAWLEHHFRTYFKIP